MNTTHENQLASPTYEREGFAKDQTWLNDGAPAPDPVYFDAISRHFLESSFCVTAHGLIDGKYYELLDVCYVHRMM